MLLASVQRTKKKGAGAVEGKRRRKEMEGKGRATTQRTCTAPALSPSTYRGAAVVHAHMPRTAAACPLTPHHHTVYALPTSWPRHHLAHTHDPAPPHMSRHSALICSPPITSPWFHQESSDVASRSHKPRTRSVCLRSLHRHLDDAV
jgi:hypothetical protein